MPTVEEQLIAEFQPLESERAQFESLWEEIAELVLTRRDFTTHRAAGEKRHNRVFDSIGIWANEQLASGLHSSLTNPTLKWFSLRLADDELDKRDDVRAWLDAVRNIMLNSFSTPKSNFHAQAHELYLDLCAFGTSCMFIDSPAGFDGVRFSTRPLGECYFKENSSGKIDAIWRRLHFTARQAVQEYKAENLPDEITEKMNKPSTAAENTSGVGRHGAQGEDRFEFLHIVRPNEDRQPGQERITFAPWESRHIYIKGKQSVKKSGFREFPFITPRWNKVSGETYGRSPAMTALPDIKMLQEIARTVLKGAQKIVDPPLMIPDDGFLLPLNTIPGGFNYFRTSTPDKVEPLLTGGNPALGVDIIEKRQEAVLRAFFMDLFNLREGPRMTATEVLQRREESLRLMAPMVSRQQVENQGPLIDRVFALKSRRGDFPDPPADIQRLDIEVDFVGPAAMAQRVSATNDIRQFLSDVLPVLEVDPGAAKRIDIDAYVKLSARLRNVPPEIIRTDEAVKAIEQAQQEQAEQQQALAQAQQAGEAGKSLKEAGVLE